jgi:hypothetical protein
MGEGQELGCIDIQPENGPKMRPVANRMTTTGSRVRREKRFAKRAGSKNEAG